jgi:hypothetical protein
VREWYSSLGRLNATVFSALRYHCLTAAAQQDRPATNTRRVFQPRLVGALLTLCVLLLTACSSAPPPKPSTGVAYAGPPALLLRSDLGAKSQTVATAKHGDRLEVLETRRRFVKVRTASAVEGWTDTNQLLSERQMADLRLLAASAAKLPSQGSAKVYAALNIHAEPYRLSPSFFQISEGATVAVIGHRVSPRSQPPPPPTPAVVHHAASPKKTKSKAASGPAPLRPPPQPPPPPSNWLALSKLHSSGSTGPSSSSPGIGPAQAPPPEDDWDLVRMPNGDTGWGLSSKLVMAIPDEVAQYAEGHRVTSYLPVGEVQDKTKGETKQNWMWTTASAGLRPYDFDSFRVFVWSSKRHHYETAYIERNVKGYYPVETQPLPGQDEKAFSVVLEDKDGKLYQRTYAFNGYHIRMVSKLPYQPAPPLPEVHASAGFEPEAAPAAPPSTSWSNQLRDWWKRVRGT